MFINAITKVAILVLAAVGVISAVPLEVRDHEDFEYKMLQASNWYRSQHGANALSWDQGLADYAANHASYCTRNHSVRIQLTSQFTIHHLFLSFAVLILNLSHCRAVLMAKTWSLGTGLPRLAG